MSTNNKEAAEREAFETDTRAWIAATGDDADYYADLVLQRTSDGERYPATWVQARWEGWLARSALTASEAPATEPAPPLPEFDYYVTLENGDDYGCWSRQTMREYAEQYAAWKIAALRSEQAPEGEVPMGSRELNDACWSFVDAMPHQLPGPIWNNLKPAIKAAIEKYLALSTPPAVPKNLREVKRTSDFSVELVFASCRAASEFALSAAPAAPQPQKEQPCK